LEDDVTRIELQAVSGIALAAIGLWYDDFNGGSPVTQDLLDVLTYNTGVNTNDKPFRNKFPFMALPHAGDGSCGGTPVNSAIQPEAFVGGISGSNSRSLGDDSQVFANNYPNPFQGNTNIRYAVENETEVNISIFDRSGKLIKTLVNETRDKGEYQVTFEGQNLPAGMYFAKISTDGGRNIQVLKMSKN
jgi:hypothetical protein